MIQAGSKVAYSKAFLRSIMASPTDPMWRARGEVKSIKKLGSFDVAIIKWDLGYGERLPEKVRTGNLVLVEELHKELA